MSDRFDPLARYTTPSVISSDIPPAPEAFLPEPGAALQRYIRGPRPTPESLPRAPGESQERYENSFIEVELDGENHLVAKTEMARRIAESGNPQWEGDRAEVTELLHMLTGRTREEIYNNLDGMLAHYAGRPVPIDEARTTIGQWWRNGLMVRKGNQIKREFRDAVLSGDQQRADQLYERLDRIVGYVDSNNVTTGNWFADSAVKPFLEMVPRLADPIFQGATLNLATQAAIVGVASLFGAPVSGGATLAGLPYALGLAAAAGPATGMVASSMEWADQIHADQFYQLYSMTDAEGNRMDPHIISAVMWPLAGVSALVESVQLSQLLPSGLAMRGVTQEFITKMVANGTIRNWAFEGIARYGATVGDEAFEELLQGVIDGTARMLATEVQNRAGGAQFDVDTFEQMAKESLQEFTASIGPVALMALPGGTINAASIRGQASVRQQTAAPEIEKPTVGVDFNEETGKFEVWAGRTMVLETEDEANAKQHAETATTMIDEAWAERQAAQPAEAATGTTPAAQSAPVGVAPRDTETGRLQTEVETVGRTERGETLTIKAGDPETGKRTGYVTFDEEPNRVYIHDVVTEGDEDVRADLVMEVMARNPGKEIVWDVIEAEDTPAAVSNNELKQQLIAQNPRGPEAGLQYFEARAEQATTEIAQQPQLTQEIFLRKYSVAFNMDRTETEQMSGLIDAIVKTRNEWTGESLTADQFLRKLVEPQVVAQEAPQQQLASAGAVAGIGFQAGDQPVSPLKVGEFKGQVRAVFAAVQDADFHHGVHEFFHAVERLALVPQQVSLMEEAVGKPRDQWTERDLETLADRFEDYLGTGRAPTPELRTLFQQIADLLWEIVSFLKERFAGPPTAEQIATAREARLSPEFEAAYDALFTTQQRAEAQPTRAQETVPEQVVDTIVQPEAQGPDSAPVITAFEPVETPVVSVPTADVSLSDEVPNFKEGADAKGIIAPLKGGEYVTVPAYPILLWERLSGKLELITGRHRLDLIKRLGMDTIPYAQIVREADGFTADMAMTQDAESNIREEKGTVRDYANYFRYADPGTITEKQASRRGLLDSHKGRTGFALGRYASDDLYTSYRNGRIRDTKAAAIASAAIGNEALQAEGIKRAADLDPDELINYLNILNNATPENEVEQSDLFGRDESFMKDAAALAKEAVKVQKELKTEYSALKSAVRLGKDAQRKVVEAYGFEAGDSRAMKGRMYELEQEIESWTDWYMDADKHAELRGRLDGGNRLFHKAATDTEAFKQWFGDSKVVDENGEPLVVYHGTDAEWTIYDPDMGGTGGWTRAGLRPEAAQGKNAVFITTSSKQFAEIYGEARAFYVRIERPIVVDAVAELENWIKEEQLNQSPQEYINDLGDFGTAYSLDDKIIELTIDAKNSGADGFIIKTGRLTDPEIGPMGDIVGSFGPTQIKSATANRGMFDPNSPNILYHRAATDTEAFKQWFGDSKIINEDGSPMEVYHGSAAENIEVFDRRRAGTVQTSDWGEGIYFTPSAHGADYYRTEALARKEDPEAERLYSEYEAETKRHGTRPMYETMDLGFGTPEYNEVKAVYEKYSDHMQAKRESPGGRVYPVYLKIENPLVYQYVGITDPYLTEQAVATGHDGIVIINEEIPAGESLSAHIDEIIALEPNQIKSAIANRGAFDPRSPNMLYHRAIEGSAVMGLKAKKIFGTTPDPNEAGYILPDGDMLDFSGRHRETDQESKDYYFGKRTLDHRALFGIRGGNPLSLKGTGTDAMLEFQRKAGALRIDAKAGVISTLTAPTDAQLRQAVKAMNEAAGSLYVALEDHKGRGVAMWQGMRATVPALRKFFIENARGKNAVSTLFHSAPDPWILKSVEILRAKMQGPMPGTNIKAMLNKAGVKPDEMKWLNLDEYLETSEKRSLDDVLEWIEQNDVKVEDKVLGAGPPTVRRGTRDDPAALSYATLQGKIADIEGLPFERTDAQVTELNRLREERDNIDVGTVESTAAPRYEQYALPGGTEGTYGELLLTLPAPAETQTERIWLRAQAHRDFDAGLITRVERNRILDETDPPPVFTSSHWKEPNVVAHARYKLHDSVDGPVLLIEEIQSDWHQKGREEGYSDRPIPQVAGLEESRDPTLAASWFWAVDEAGNRLTTAAVFGPTRAEALATAQAQVNERFADRLVPGAPFRKTWHELTFRRMLRFATEAGVKRIAWTTGQQQADRYQLSNVIDAVIISKIADGEWVLKADKGDTPVLSQEADNPEAFIPYVGKELVKKAVDEIGDRPAATAIYEGLEMNVGGEGMKGFYDKILVNYAKKYGKKFGASVEDVEIETSTEYFEDFRHNEPLNVVPTTGMGRFTITLRDTNVTWGAFDTKADAERQLKVLKAKWEGVGVVEGATVHSLPITADMEAAVSQGQYLFHQADNWKGQFIYGSAIDKDIYQTYVDQAKQFDDVGKFQEMMRALYADLDVKAEEIKAADEFLAEVFKVAEAQKAGEPEATGIESPELPEFSQYNPQDKYDAARDITDKDLAKRFESGDVTESDLDEFALKAESDHEAATAAGVTAEEVDRGRRAELESEQQGLLDLGDEIDSAIEGLAAMPADSSRRARAEARLKDLYRRFRKALFADLETAEDLVEEAVWERAIVLRETLQEPDLVGRLGEAGEEAVRLGRDLQKALDNRKLKGAMEKRTEAGRESRARIYAKKRADIKRSRAEIRQRYKNREAVRLMRQARIKLMKSIMRKPGKGVEFRGYAETIRQIQDALDPLAPDKRSQYQKLHSRKFLAEHPDVKIYMTEDWLDNIYAQAHPNFTINDLERINEIIQRLREDGRHKRAQVVEAERELRKREQALAANATLRGEMPEEFVGGAKPSSKALKFVLEGWKPDRIVQMLQGGTEEGVYQRLLQDDVNAAWSLMQKAVRKRVTPMKARMRGLKLTLDPLDPKILASGFSFVGRSLELGTFRTSNNRKITAQQAMYWSIGMKNDHTRAALLSGNNYPPDIIMKGIAQLTEAELALATAIGKDYNLNFPRYRDAFIDAFNMDLPGEDNYVSMHRLQRSYETRFEQVGNELLGRTGNRRIYVDRSATHQRIEIADEHQTPIRDDLVTLWMEDVISQEGFIHQDALLKRLHAVFESDQVTHAIRQKYGEAANKWVKKLINDLAQADAYEAQDGIARVARVVRHHQALAYLGFSARTILTQMSGPINYLADAGPIDMGWAAAQYVGGKMKGVAENGVLSNTMIDFVNERTELLRHRNFSQEIDDFRRASPKLYANIIKKIGTVGMTGLAMVDQLTVYIGWRAVYNRTLRQTKGDEAAAIHAADKSTIRTQPSNRVQDMAQLYRHGDVVKLFTQFTSELSVNFNRLTFDVPMAIKRGHVMKAFADLVAIGLVGVMISVVRGGLYKDDDDEKKEAILRGAGAEFVETIPIIGRDIGNVVAGNYWNNGVSLVPAAQHAALAASQLTGGDAERAALSGAKALSLGLGLPYTGVRRAVLAIQEQDAAELLGWKR